MEPRNVINDKVGLERANGFESIRDHLPVFSETGAISHESTGNTSFAFWPARSETMFLRRVFSPSSRRSWSGESRWWCSVRSTTLSTTSRAGSPPELRRISHPKEDRRRPQNRTCNSAPRAPSLDDFSSWAAQVHSQRPAKCPSSATTYNCV